MNWVLELYLGICGALLLYYLVFFRKLLFFKPKQYAPEKLPPVSVVICAKNEAENLEKNLKVVLIQNYPKFEVIVVNDQSTDATAKVVEKYIERNPNLRLINIKKDIEKPMLGKKFPLKVGIEAAIYETIAVTDADCKPSNTLWLQHLIADFLHETKFVLGYAPFTKASGFINKLIRFDNVMTAMQYFSYALMGMPYMGVGRNMAFKKSVFQEWNGFEKYKHVISGDDDLFVNANAKTSSTEIALNKDSFIYSQPKATYAEWMTQKSRHAKTSYHYKLHHRLLLFLFALLNFAVYLTPLLFVFYPEQYIFGLIAIFGTVLVKFVFHARISGKLNNHDLIPYLPILDFIFVINLPLLFFKSLTSPNKEWK